MQSEIAINDVTTEYYPANKVEVSGVKDAGKKGLIGVFSMNGWIPIGTYKQSNGTTFVENMEAGQISHP